MRKLAWALGIVGAVLAGTVIWLFYVNGSPDGASTIDIAAIRREAAWLPGPGPERIEAETVSHDAEPKIAMVAGAGWGKIDLVRVSYRLVWPDRSIVLDTGYDEQTARGAGIDSFDPAAYARVIHAMDAASVIIVTHEHGDHIGGLMSSPHLPQELPKALLTPEQFDNGAEVNRRIHLAWPAWARAAFRPFRYDGIRAIAPGVVLISAPGHTPGSQMVYVRRADGRELMFMGDTASMLDNVRTGHIRSHLVTDWLSGDDRAAVLRWTAALGRLSTAEPGIALVPGHDGEAIAALERSGLLLQGFRF